MKEIYEHHVSNDQNCQQSELDEGQLSYLENLHKAGDIKLGIQC